MDGKLTTYFRKRRIATPSAPTKATNAGPANVKTATTTESSKTQQEVQYSQKLELPDHYKALADIFRCTDICVAYIHNRQEMCTFNKLRKPVERMTKKAFNLQRLSQIMTVLPKAYHLRYDYSLPDSSSYKDFTQSPNRYTEKLIIDIKIDDHQVRPRHLDERRDQFNKNLLAIVARHHEEFLDRSKISKPQGPVRRWHPFFKLDEVKPIEAKSLEVEPDKSMRSPSKQAIGHSVERVLARAKRRLVWDEIPGCSNAASNPSGDTIIDVEIDANNNTPVKAFPGIANSPVKAIARSPMKSPTKPLFQGSPAKKLALDPSVPPKQDIITSGPLKGLSMSLLEKIKVRELEDAKVTPETEHKNDIMSRLPEIVRTIHTYFTSEGKECMPHDKVINRIMTSATIPATAMTINECIDMLLEVLPNWISTIRITRGRYMRINKTISLQTVIKQLEDH